MRIRVRAVILQSGAVLLIHRIKGKNEYWVFPGGGMEKGDTDPQGALIRECKEELGVDIKVGELFDSQRLKLQEKEREELFFFSEIVGGKLGTGKGPEFQGRDTYKGEYVIEWVPKDRLSRLKVLPVIIKQKLAAETM